MVSSVSRYQSYPPIELLLDSLCDIPINRRLLQRLQGQLDGFSLPLVQHIYWRRLIHYEESIQIRTCALHDDLWSLRHERRNNVVN